MAGFDPSEFLAPRLPLDGGGPTDRGGAPPLGQGAGSAQSERNPAGSSSVAGVAASRRLDDGTLIVAETGEILDGWADAPGTVAGVAGVAATHDLPLTAPFARELNAMFSYPPPAYLKRGAWKRLCEGARKFAETKAADALAAGWEPVELFGVHRHPWKRGLAVNGIVWLSAGRGIGTVEAHAIEILNKQGAHNRAYRAHFMSQRGRAALMWEAFHPDNRRPDGSGKPEV